jgi:hypothetical protein
MAVQFGFTLQRPAPGPYRTAMDVDWHLPFRYPRSAIPRTTHFRSTWIASSLKTMKEQGHYDRWYAAVDPKYRDVIVESVAGVWLPVDVAYAHYAAYNDLGLPSSVILALGNEVAKRMHASLLGTLMRLSRNVGVTPWTALSHFQRIWDRIWMGGDVSVERLGPKEARVECVGCPLLSIPHYRHGFRGVQSGLIEMFCTKAFVTEERTMLTADSAGWRIAWA